MTSGRVGGLKKREPLKADSTGGPPEGRLQSGAGPRRSGARPGRPRRGEKLIFPPALDSSFGEGDLLFSGSVLLFQLGKSEQAGRVFNHQGPDFVLGYSLYAHDRQGVVQDMGVAPAAVLPALRFVPNIL